MQHLALHKAPLSIYCEIGQLKSGFSGRFSPDLVLWSDWSRGIVLDGLVFTRVRSTHLLLQ